MNGLDRELSAQGPSSKYERLRLIRDLVRVPQSLLLDASFFSQALADHAELDRALGHLLEEIGGTAGAFLDEHATELATLLAALRLRPAGLDLLAARLATAFSADELQGRFAVRSAAPQEDGGQRSHAGLYRSLLEVSGLEAIATAVCAVWASYFSYPALLERLTAGTLNPTDRMAVLIQPMVRARWAGVCFTADPLGGPEAVIELVPGLGDALLAGASAGIRLTASEVRAGGGPAAAGSALQALLAVLAPLRERLGFELDLEWAWDGAQLFVLQVRPISTLASAVAVAGPVCEAVPLYAAHEGELTRFAPLPEFAVHFRTKRGPLFSFAQAHGVAAGEAWLLRCNPQGLDSPALERLLARFRAAEIVVDAHVNYRQRILGRSALRTELQALSPRGEVRVVVLRDYLRGDKGVISRALPTGLVVYEVANEGLLALNRGTAAGRRYQVQGVPTAAPELPVGEVERFVLATRAAAEQLGPCQLEWVVVGEQLLIVDYSPLVDPLPATADWRLLSPGFATGPVLRLEQGEALRRLSEGPAVSLKNSVDLSASSVLQELRRRVQASTPKPIVLAPRPFAVLATLIPHVSGFIFEQAATLCHLAILLREHNVPAIASAESYGALEDGVSVTLDTESLQLVQAAAVGATS